MSLADVDEEELSLFPVALPQRLDGPGLGPEGGSGVGREDDEDGLLASE
jgi:hypothetical protein